MGLLCNKVFSNEAINPLRLSHHLPKIHTDKVGKDATFFQSLWDNFERQKTVGPCLQAYRRKTMMNYLHPIICL